ncbi:hypothetical protein [Paenibacillus periandrae]|uniref:hypothetical protein n=1 Tax=Paenibacillus periandrae TaxID=1761741 RepID=UPI001F0A00FD|nr:hypothetical protein [Paenibacillus periandrae]
MSLLTFMQMKAQEDLINDIVRSRPLRKRSDGMASGKTITSNEAASIVEIQNKYLWRLKEIEKTFAETKEPSLE